MLEKLNLKCPVDEIKNHDDVWKLQNFLLIEQTEKTANNFLHDARILLAQRKQWERMLAEQIENLICLENIYAEPNSLGIYGFVLRSRIDNTREIIEQCIGIGWDEIKEKIGK